MVLTSVAVFLISGRMQDKQFGKLALFTAHNNPPAKVISPIKSYKQFTIQRAYRGETFFWGLMPQAGDMILFEFEEPLDSDRIFTYRIRSGNFEHPSDLLYNTSLEIRPVELERARRVFPRITDNFAFVGKDCWISLVLLM